MRSRLVHRLDRVRDAFGKVTSQDPYTRKKGLKEASFLAGQTLTEMIEETPHLHERNPMFSEALGAMYGTTSLKKSDEVSWDKTFATFAGPIIYYMSIRGEKTNVPMSLLGLAVLYYGTRR